MNRITAEKVKFFMDGLGQRVSDGEISSIGAVFRSGLKNYALKTDADSLPVLKFNFSGNSYELDHAGFVNFICGLVPDFDELVLTYTDDFKDNQIIAKDRDVTFRTKDLSASSDEKNDILNYEKEAHEAVFRASMGNRAYFVRPENPNAAKMLKAIGVMGDNGKIKNDKIRKYNQIDHFIELIDPMLRKICEEKAKSGAENRTVNIVDCACGKSYLSFALCYYIRFVLKTPCYFTGLDYNGIVIDDSKKIADSLGYTNMKFIETDIGKFEPDRKYDLLITLHACDIATDLALRFGIDHDIAAMVCVPCCHKEMNSQGYVLEPVAPILKYGILKARIADSITDGLRGLYLEGLGYDVSMVEYISPLDTPKNLMMRIVKKRDVNTEKLNEFNSICSALGVKLSIARER